MGNHLSLELIVHNLQIGIDGHFLDRGVVQKK